MTQELITPVDVYIYLSTGPIEPPLLARRIRIGQT